MTPRHFLSIENRHNWLADQATGFTLFGVSQRGRHVAGTLSKGDYIVTYVEGTGFADVRCVTGECFAPLSGRVAYDEAFVHALETKPIAVIASENHIPMKRIGGRLEFYDSLAQGKTPTQPSLRLLSQDDGLLLVSLIVATAKAERIAMLPSWHGHEERGRFVYI